MIFLKYTPIIWHNERENMKQIIINLLSDPIVWGVLLTVLFIVIGIIVSKTKTKKDDEIYEAVLRFIQTAFNIAEKAIPDGSVGRMKKIDIALKDFNDRYEARFGKSAPAEYIEKAKAEWAIMAEELKKQQGKVV